MELKIENISLIDNPDTIRPRKRGVQRVYRWEDLAVGQSYFVPYDDVASTPRKMMRRMQNNLSWAKRQGLVAKEVELAYAPHTKKGVDGMLVGRV